MTKQIRPLLAGNWKMNGTRASLDQIKAIAEGVRAPLSERIDTLLCPPATLLYVATALCDDSPLAIGAQDCHQLVSGAHTGDISAEMIADCFGTHVIVGHSERRRNHVESDALVRAKAEAALNADLIAIVCIGETAEERDNAQTLDVLKRQLAGSVPDGSVSETTVIAYEPVWAIGTGKVPTRADVEEAHAFIRGELVERFGEDGKKFRLLYGGSVSGANAADLLSVANVNGLLVGGQSLKAVDFLAIYGAFERQFA
ncbi:triose-phosphate isomerase [Rhizobium rhizogenes]|uniref:triose-phosphate isomerase n=1 Tax=Rhizobium rhizogenes TaxID=359 RepID=UPI0015743B6E|nr:triose-phosphate isomerase [Rhizobium rhizogenes]NTI22305.1 triose-phosphate isomerase [Rhizobium rhizogenes]QTG05895.1 triose-phosphate isomerase [Rhizobium rhizogenes]